MDFEFWKLLYSSQTLVTWLLTKQPLSNFELRSESLENITNFEGWDLTLVAYKKCNYEFNAVSTRLIKIC